MLDDTTALLKVKVCSSRDNAHELYIEDDALREASPTVLGKPIVAKYSRYTRDLMGHEEDEMPVGYIIDSQTPEFITEDSGAISLIVYAILWKEYVPEVFSLFETKKELNQDAIKQVSMEIYMSDVAVDDENNAIIKQFNFRGVTLLGDSYAPACELAHAEMVVFSNRVKESESLFFQAMAHKNKLTEEKEDAMSKELETPKAEEAVKTEQQFEAEIAEEEKVTMEAPPVSEDEPENEESAETEEEDMACKEEMSVDYQAKFEELQGQFTTLQAEFTQLKERNDELEAKFAEKAEIEKNFAIEQVLMKFESKLSKEQIAEFKERAKEVKPDNTNAFINEIKAFAADILVESTETKSAENRMEILTPVVEEEKPHYTW